MLKNLMKAAIGTAVLPLDVAKDLITGFGMVDGDDPATLKRLRQIMRNLDEAVDPHDEDW